MNCQFLLGSKIRYCLADDRLLVPSLLELTEYCCCDPENCPLYKEKEACPPKKEMHSTPAAARQEAATEYSTINRRR